MTKHKFEHPLNEKTRIYLRVEALMRQMHHSASFVDNLQYHQFFRSIFDLLEIFEQIQLKAELAKDLEKQRLNYKHWLNVDGVDQEKLLTVLEELDTTHKYLMAAERFGRTLKEDRFLSSIRQRFNLPGGTCCFDLPALHYWNHLPIEQRQRNAQGWMNTLAPLSKSLNLWLKLCRETGYFNPQIARNGFYQSDAEEANILRLNIPLADGVFPMISGHKNRFAIKFMSFDNGQAYSQDVEFDLAICN
ncbi:cell division protein ZapD [Vibrio sp. VB16]|uniref:cell division protein ZapD n=1 Tax=Vibrio sp. VB16 TaxID=2785746 RepID=UPI00189E740B|nr:cell division protein ZapD [Vibrio sp. VB16]UGA54321.1 cell division protein ZapD [Vibrio sp. VB16]